AAALPARRRADRAGGRRPAGGGRRTLARIHVVAFHTGDPRSGRLPRVARREGASEGSGILSITRRSRGRLPHVGNDVEAEDRSVDACTPSRAFARPTD